MKPKSIWSAIAVGFLFISVGVQADQRPTTSQRSLFGTIVAFEGEVYLNDGPMAVGQKVFEEDKIKTSAGKAEIESDGSRFLIGPHSEITLGPPLSNDYSFIHCIKGTLRSVIHKLLGQSFQVKTKFVTAGIRGTEFIMHTTPTAGVLFTEEGTVQLDANGKQVDVGKMQMSQAGDGIAPLQPESISAHPQLNALLNEVRQFCDMNIPAEISGKRELNDIIARWDLNFSSYLVDKEEYDKAQKLSLLAFLIAEKPELKAEARFWRGTIFLRFKGEARTALQDFEEIIKNFGDTPSFEQALYHRGLSYYDLRRMEEAKADLDEYLRIFPNGRYQENARVILEKISGQ